ncbi:hypothetical protein HOLleu_38590 [Holothuria leucospilota]|uniref:Ig-like domain-containing protein n=1 Tax=Holothuria leucospilota TaxID=206669 RepID=A0A9Q0YM65_HOLLE|nr:hypothetical protein HOLleu_38590 [Holothuria leucospilota]
MFGDISNYLTSENISAEALPFPLNESVAFQFMWTNLTKEDDGNYTCYVNQNSSASLPLKVSEIQKSVLCESSIVGHQQYLVGEELELTCHSPFHEDPDLIPVWYLMNGSVLQGSGKGIVNTSFPNSTAVIFLTEEDNFTNFNCNLTKKNTVLRNPSHSCSVGPILVSRYDLYIQSAEGSSVLSTGSITINCGITPPNDEVSFCWTVDSFQMNKTSSYGSESNLTLYNFLLGTEYVLKVNVTCVGKLRGVDFTAEYFVEVYNVDVNVYEPLTNSLERLIIIASSTLLILIAIVVTIFGCNYTIVPFLRGPHETNQTEPMAKDGLERKRRRVLNTYAGETDMKQHARPLDETLDCKTVRASVTSYLTDDSSFSNNRCDYEYASDESYEEPSCDYVDASSGFNPTLSGGQAPQFDAYGRPSFVQSHPFVTSVNEGQMDKNTIPKSISTWENEMLYDETSIGPQSHHSGDSFAEYEFPDDGKQMGDETILNGMPTHDEEQIYDDTSRCPSSHRSEESPPEYEFPESEDSSPEYDFPDEGMTDSKQTVKTTNQEVVSISADEMSYEEPPNSPFSGYSDEPPPEYGQYDEKRVSATEDDDLLDYENFDMANY